MNASERHILFVCPQPFFQWRGSPIRVAFDVQALAELGYTVDLLTLPVGESRDIPGVRVCRVGNPLGVKTIPIGPSPSKLVFDLLLLLRGLRMVRHHRYAAVHGVEEAGALGVWLARRGRCRLVYEKHSDPASHKKGFIKNLVLAVYARVERATARRADAVIGTGEGLVQQVRDCARGALYHVPDIPSSRVDATADTVARLRAELTHAPGDCLVTYVGSFAVYQGIDLLFDAIPLAVKQCPTVRFVIIGGTPDEIAHYHVRLEAQGVADRVQFVGKVAPDSLPGYLAASDILLSPRLTGVNTPLKLLDYLKARGAVVATDTPANRLILNPDNAELTAPDPAAFAAGIARLAVDPERRAALAARGYELIETTYNYDEFKKRLGACYAQVLGRETRQ